MTIHDYKIDIVVQSKYPYILQEFKAGFFETTKEFTNLRLHVIDGELYGAKEINKILRPITARREQGAFGVFNDDMWFVYGWLESVIESLQSHECVSAGYVETDKLDVFANAVEQTKNINGFVPFLYGPNAVFRTDIFEKIGMFDERFDWSVDDLDWAWRIKLNGMSSITLKRITMAHKVGTTLTQNNKKLWHQILKVNQELFYDKHGYRSYRELRNHYQNYHSYFKKYAA